MDDCKGPRNYVFFNVTQIINNVLRFRTKIFPWDTTEVFAPLQSYEPVKDITTISQVLKDAKPQARRALHHLQPKT